MKKLLLIALVAGGLASVPVQHSDAQIFIGIPGFVGIGIGPGYYPYGYYGGPSYYWYQGHRVYYHHHHHHYYHTY